MPSLRVTDTGEVVYPYSPTKKQLRADFPRTLFKANPASSDLNAFGIYEVEVDEKPDVNETFVQLSHSEPQKVDGVWRVSWIQQAHSLSDIKEEMIAQVRTKASTARDAGVDVGGVLIATTAEARSLLVGARMSTKPTRKIVTEAGDRLEVTDSQFIAIVDAVDDYIQAVMDNEFALLESIAAAATVVALESIDIEQGWP
ncbi:MAG: hypothetical protein R3332_08275 [Pseudohongiellaceae bacterium]|nr:hypothetical protein [Pseudohongiellaceae bacterium]